jgi:hypothetical protein
MLEELDYRRPFLNSWNNLSTIARIVLFRLYSWQVFDPTNVEDLLFAWKINF